MDIAPHPVLVEAIRTGAPVMIRLADALSPKGEWAGPFVWGRRHPEGKFSQGWKHVRCLADWYADAPHARRLVDAMTVAEYQAQLLGEPKAVHPAQ